MRAQLTPAEEEIAYECAITGDTLANTARLLGFASRMDFHRYCLAYPEFAKALQFARLAGNTHIEDEIRHITDTETDPKAARVKMECLCRLLAFRDPAKYGARVDINMHTTVDIGSSLARMQARLAESYAPIDVTPEIPNEIKQLL